MSSPEYTRYPPVVRPLGRTRPIASQWCSVRTLTPASAAARPTVRPPASLVTGPVSLTARVPSRLGDPDAERPQLVRLRAVGVDRPRGGHDDPRVLRRDDRQLDGVPRHLPRAARAARPE